MVSATATENRQHTSPQETNQGFVLSYDRCQSDSSPKSLHDTAIGLPFTSSFETKVGYQMVFPRTNHGAEGLSRDNQTSVQRKMTLQKNYQGSEVWLLWNFVRHIYSLIYLST